MALEDIYAEIRGCDRCGLRTGCTQVVPGEGPEDATMVFVGEAPGADEDKSGRPFVGRSGQHLRMMIRECRLPEDKIFITNTVRCRPPENRDPTPEEIESCWPWTVKLLQEIRPKVIVTLGKPALKTLSYKFQFTKKVGSLPITKVAGVPIYLEDRRCYVYPVLHPSYALRRNEAREDFAAQLRYLVVALPGWLRRP